MKRFIFLMIIFLFQNCLKEYPESYECDVYIKLYLFGDQTLQFINNSGQGTGTLEFDKDRVLTATLLTCLRAQQLRKADPPKFYEDPEPW